MESISVTFDGTFEGFLSVVYAVYYEKLAPATIQAENCEQLTLFGTTVEAEESDIGSRYITTDEKKAFRVFSAIREKISPEAADHILYAFLANDEGRFLPMLHYIKLGFSVGHMINSHLHESCVRLVQKLAKQVGREAHLLYGFCRFEETSTAFYCPITPKNDVLQLIASHFSRRMMNELWVIHDKVRKKAAVYDGKSYVILPADDAEITHTAEEAETRELWTAFFKALVIKERVKPKLQRQLLPLHFRKNMTEFK